MSNKIFQQTVPYITALNEVGRYSSK